MQAVVTQHHGPFRDDMAPETISALTKIPAPPNALRHPPLIGETEASGALIPRLSMFIAVLGHLSYGQVEWSRSISEQQNRVQRSHLKTRRGIGGIGNSLRFRALGKVSKLESQFSLPLGGPVGRVAIECSGQMVRQNWATTTHIHLEVPDLIFPT